MTTIRQLLENAEGAFQDSEFLKALQLFSHCVKSQPENLDTRLRVADCLLALGMLQEAAQVYAMLARHATHAGYPLRAIVALKVLSALEPKFEGSLSKIAEIYSKESTRLGRGVRVSLGDPCEDAPEAPSFRPSQDSTEIIKEAAETACALDKATARYPEKVPPIPLLSDLSVAGFERLVRSCKVVRAKKNHTIIRQGEVGTSFFMVARGGVEIVQQLEQDEERMLAKLGPGSIFGEMALVSASPRGATVRTTEEADLLEFDKESLTAASKEIATIATALDAFTQRRLLNNLLSTAPFFRPLNREQRISLVRHFRAIEVQQGSVILEEGDPPKGLFVVLRGEVDVSKKDGKDRVLLATLKPGDVFGEIAMVRNEKASATVRAASPCAVLLLEHGHFSKLIEGIPQIRDYVEGLSESRVEETELVLGVGFATIMDEDDTLIDTPPTSVRGTMPPAFQAATGEIEVVM